jgi:hypothetical protein
MEKFTPEKKAMKFFTSLSGEFRWGFAPAFVLVLPFPESLPFVFFVTFFLLHGSFPM